MKSIHVLFLFLFLFLSKSTLNGMPFYSERNREKERILSLEYLTAKSINKKIIAIVKEGFVNNYPTESTLDIVSTIDSCLTEPTKDMVCKDFICTYATKIFARQGNCIQCFDGRMLTASERLNPSHPSKVCLDGHWSHWTNLKIDELIKKYSAVYYAYKNKNAPHPFCPFVRVNHIRQVGLEDDDFLL